MKKILYVFSLLILFELFLRVINYGHSNVYFYENDKQLGYKLKSNISSGLYIDLKDKNFMSTNESGYRIFDKPYSKTLDYLLLGDGVVSGWAYPNQYTLEYQINELLSHDKNYMKVLNLSVPGYGTVQQYLQLEKFLNVTEYNIKNIILLFNSDNDFFNNSQIIYGLPSFYNNQFSFSEHKYLNFFNQHLTFFYSYRFLQNIKNIIFKIIFNQQEVLVPLEYDENTINNTKQLLDMMKNVSNQKNINFYIIDVGDNCEYIKEYCLKKRSLIAVERNKVGHYEINTLKKLAEIIVRLK